MGRSRVLSFMSAFGAPKTPQSSTYTGPEKQTSSQQDVTRTSSPLHVAAPARDSPTPPRTRTERSSSRPMSMVQTYQPPLMDLAQDTIPELLPIFTFLNSHANKLYQEGYFLKLNDLDSHGRPNADRSWTESFAQLVGTVLSLWDASALDAAGQDGEVAPTFINLADASIKMIETLPTRSADVQPLQNVLSISTAGKNRYLFHFNSLHSLTQWTAAIRLAMYENATLQEAYTGSLIAGKGKLLNNIKVIMDRTRIKTEDWTRVRFGAGTPWRRCWCVITPPDEKDVQKQQKQLRKKSAYERVAPLKGNIKFYDTRKTKKAQPIATIHDAYSAYAIYPQSKPLIDQSTLIKVEGSITIHSTPEITTEGFVFVMPEVHPAVTGFEMMLRYLFPLYDVFALYGRPNRLVADTLDTRSLMFALPQERRYGYLEILDVATLIHEKGSQAWSEREWRKKLKELTSARMTRMASDGRPRSRASSYRDYRNSLQSRTGQLRSEDGASIKSTPSLRDERPPVPPPHRSDSAPLVDDPHKPPPRPRAQHQRSFSEAVPMSTPRHQRSQRNGQDQSYTPSRLSHEQSRPSYDVTRSSGQSYEQGPPPPLAFEQAPPPPPAHVVLPTNAAARTPQVQTHAAEVDTPERSSSESERRYPDLQVQDVDKDMRPAPPPASVAAPPAFSHQPGAKPQRRPGISPELRRANSRLSVTTLSQLAEAGKNSTVGGGATAGAAAAAAWRSKSGSQGNGMTVEDSTQRGVIHAASKSGDNADNSTSREGLVLAYAGYPTPNGRGPRNVSPPPTQLDVEGTPYYKDKPLMSSYDLLSPSNRASRNVSPLSQSRTPSPPLDPIQKPAPTPIDRSRPYPSRADTHHSISRKPVPSRIIPTSQAKPQTVETPTLTSKQSLESLHERYIDEEALARILDQERTVSITSEISRGNQDDDCSVDDNDSTVSPDYASTRKSIETRRSQRSVEKPRRGVLRTVGTIEPEQPKDVQLGDVHYRSGATPQPTLDAAIPIVDFGPTQSFNPVTTTRPTTSGTMTQHMHGRSKSSDRFTTSPARQKDGPLEDRRTSVVFPSEQQRDRYERSPSRNLTTPEPHVRASSATDNDNRRSIAWQPGVSVLGSGSPGSRQPITPEQFVQQRATANRVPMYAHARKSSASPTLPNVPKQSSGERPIQQPKNLPNKLQKRQSSYPNDIPPRPNSHGASIMMNNPGDYSSHLSAREQEHVARITGLPLINMTGTRKDSSQGGGLVGAIEAREKEKKDIKEGLSGQMVQQAIAQRQQHRQPSYGTPSQPLATPTPQFAMPGQYPPSPQSYGFPQQQYGSQGQYGHQELQGQYQQQVPQQQRQWAPTAPWPYNGAPQELAYPQQPQQYQQGQYPPGNYTQQGQQHYYGAYSGNAQEGR